MISRFLLCLAVVAIPLPAMAGSISFSASGVPTNATLSVNVAATFTNVGGNLEIDLTNSSAGTDPLQILSGLVWSVTGTAPTGTSLSSAKTASGSALYTNASTSTSNAELRNTALGGQKGWQYLAPPGKLNGTTVQFGLGASGLGGTFGGLGNASYGITGPGSSIGHVPVSNQLPLVMSTSSSPSGAVFVIAGFNADISSITGVMFAFGSAGTNNLTSTSATPNVTPTPEPSTLVLSALGGIALLAYRKHRRPKA